MAKELYLKLENLDLINLSNLSVIWEGNSEYHQCVRQTEISTGWAWPWTLRWLSGLFRFMALLLLYKNMKRLHKHSYIWRKSGIFKENYLPLTWTQVRRKGNIMACFGPDMDTFITLVTPDTSLCALYESLLPPICPDMFLSWVSLPDRMWL